MNYRNPADSAMPADADDSPALSLKMHRKFRNRFLRKEQVRGLLFLVPWLIGVVSFVLYPLIFSFYISFNRLHPSPEGSGLQYDFVGWANYKYAFIVDNIFPVEMVKFVQQSILTVPITVLFALLISLLLNQKFPGRMIYRTIFFLPVIFATGQVLTELFNEGQGSIPFVAQYHMDETIYSLFSKSVGDSIMGILNQFVIILWFSGIQVIIFLAAYQTVSPSTYEAAQIDGVTPWESFWKITLPAIMPFIILNLIYTIIDLATFPFNPVLGHISDAVGDVKLGYGYGSALGWIYFAVIFIPIGWLVLLARVQSMKERRG